MNEDALTLHELVEMAHKRLPDFAWSYIVGGSDSETTLQRNRQALDSLALRARVLNNVSEVDTTGTLFGNKVRLPVLLCPIGGLEAFDPNGALSVASAASAFGVPMMLSSVSDWTPEKLVTESGSAQSIIMQLYARDDANAIDSLLDRCAALDMPAFCVTVDSAVYSRRERDIHGRFKKPWRAQGEGESAHYQAALSWKDIKRMRARYDKPIVLKGIATVEDALKAVDHGVDVIYVSNHGGRQLDHAEGSTSVLPDIANAVQDQASIIVDGGYMRGTDIVKAIALGAEGVGLGRLMCFALAAAGPAGIIRMLDILEEESRIALALLGVRSFAELDKSHVREVQPIGHSTSWHSAYPLLSDLQI